MLVVAEPCTILCLRVTLVWPELSAPTSSINIIIKLHVRIICGYIIKYTEFTCIYRYMYTYLDLQQWSLERSLPANAQLPLKLVNYLLWTPAGQKYK